MHPIVTVFLIFVALGGLLYLYNNPALLGAGYVLLRSKMGLSNEQFVLILGGLIVAYTLYWLYGYAMDRQRQKVAEKRYRGDA